MLIYIRNPYALEEAKLIESGALTITRTVTKGFLFKMPIQLSSEKLQLQLQFQLDVDSEVSFLVPDPIFHSC